MFQPRSFYVWALLLGGAYLMYWMAVPMTPEPYRRVVLSLCERKSALFLLPFVFAIAAPQFRKVVSDQLLYFMYGTAVVCLLGNADFIYHHFVVEHGVNPLSHVHYRIIFESFTGIHPTYMSLYLAFSICVLMCAVRPQNRLQRILLNGCMYVLLVLMLALFAKALVLALGVIAGLLLIENRKKLLDYKWVFVSLVGVCAGAYFLIPFFRQRVNEAFSFFGGQKVQNITDNSVHVRKLLWQTDLSLLQHYWLTGVGPGRVLDLLHKRYFFHSIYRGYWIGYFDPHSQYFSEWLSFGVIGILFLLVVLIVQFVVAIRAKHKLYLYLLTLLSVTFFTETLLSRQQGILFYAVFTSLFFFSSLPQRVARKSND